LNQQNDQAERPLQFVKVLSWSVMALILGSSLALSIFISKTAENALLKKQEQFGLLLAENLSHQVYTRFALPVMIRFGGISLSNEEQFKRLDQVVRSTIHSFKVHDLRIYSREGMVSYSLKSDELGTKGEDVDRVRQTYESATFNASIKENISKLAALFSLRHPRPGSIMLEAFYPLRAEQNLAVADDNPIMGILEFEQDITDEYMAVINLERLIVALSLLTSLVLFVVIMTLMRRAERLNMERVEEKERLERELHQQEKLAGMGRMVAGVAHEIRNPLGIICSSSELILKKARKEEHPHTRLIQAVHEEAKRLSRTVGEFLDYARPRQPALHDVDVGKVLDQVAVFLESECEKLGVTIDRLYHGDLTVQGDKDLLYRAFYNIVSNAMQAMDGGEISISAVGDNGAVHVTVTDSGPGFDAASLDKVRDPFFTTKDTGTGLGLAIVGSILESLGAEFRLGNDADGGARVDMIFPAG
jgi:signal transduction histidine kinase